MGSPLGADVAEVFTEIGQEFRAGDRVQFTRNNYRPDRLDGKTAEWSPSTHRARAPVPPIAVG